MPDPTLRASLSQAHETHTNHRGRCCVISYEPTVRICTTSQQGAWRWGGQILNPDSATTEPRLRPLRYDGKKQKPKNSGCKRITDYINNIPESHFVLSQSKGSLGEGTAGKASPARETTWRMMPPLPGEPASDCEHVYCLFHRLASPRCLLDGGYWLIPCGAAHSFLCPPRTSNGSPTPTPHPQFYGRTTRYPLDRNAQIHFLQLRAWGRTCAWRVVDAVLKCTTQ